MSEIEKTVKDLRDTVKEGVHRGEAEGEHAKRTVAGDAMTPGEKAGSVANEAVSDTKAEIDKAKRSIRDAT
jgi:hypothetical protein